ncbi:MAG: methyltransferase domain-containing protein [Flavisolibacter sp.]
MHSHSYINSAKNILQQYDGSIPFASWLKQFFKQHKKYGSKDRRQITALCYGFYRLGIAFEDYPVEDRILLGAFLASEENSFVLQELKPEWNENIKLSVEEKLKLLHVEMSSFQLFPWPHELSEAIHKEQFDYSFLQQPFLYLRIRPGKEKTVCSKLENASIAFDFIGDNCIALANSSKIDEVIQLNKEAVVQDYNSQRIGELLQNINRPTLNYKFSVWDCCAASGGKSILAYDIIPNILLTVSDVRESILRNLKKRFEQAGISNYKSFVANLSTPSTKHQTRSFDLVICDAPCSGSGTWSRTPEQLHYFKKEKIDHYVQLQKKIAVNAAKHLKEKGYFLYITCSVFKKENEEVVAFIQKNIKLQLVNAQYFKGYDKKADTLFAALFIS